MYTLRGKKKTTAVEMETFPEESKK